MFPYSEAYHDQMGSILSSNGSLDIAYPMRTLRALGEALALVDRGDKLHSETLCSYFY